MNNSARGSSGFNFANSRKSSLVFSSRGIGTVAAETNADIGRLERRTVVHAIADHQNLDAPPPSPYTSAVPWMDEI